jgi:polyisoprenoid-binding protein YceI
MKTTGSHVILFMLFFSLAPNVLAQTTYKVSDESKMIIKGTSTLHDWESDVTQLQGEAQVELKGQQPQFQQVDISIPVESIKSGKGAMDKNTYKALEEEEYPNIQFSLNEIESIDQKTIKATGDLTVAGNTQTVVVNAEYEIKSADQISLKGSHSLKMTDFGIEPPTAVFGTIKTGDEITIDYTLRMIKNTNKTQ